MDQQQPIVLPIAVKGVVASITEEEKSSLMEDTLAVNIPQSQDFDDPNDEDFELEKRKPKKEASSAATNFKTSNP